MQLRSGCIGPLLPELLLAIHPLHLYSDVLTALMLHLVLLDGDTVHLLLEILGKRLLIDHEATAALSFFGHLLVDWGKSFHQLVHVPRDDPRFSTCSDQECDHAPC